MKKQTILILAVLIISISSVKSEAQLMSAPDATIGFTLRGTLATNEFTGQISGALQGRNYGALWGRGVGIHGKYALGKWKNNRITLSANYNQFTNSTETGKTWFYTIPSDTSILYTAYTLFGGAIGYEYVFGARCQNRPYVGVGINATMIQTDDGNTPIAYENTFRMGFEFRTGYEFTFGKNRSMAFNVMGTYKLLNAFLKDNDNTTGNIALNDGDGLGGSGYNRYIGYVGLEFGLNFNFGSKPISFRR